MERLQRDTADNRRHDLRHERRKLYSDLHAEGKLPLGGRHDDGEERELEYREGGGQPRHLPYQHDTGHHNEEQDHHGDEQDIIKADGNFYLVVSKLPKTPTVSTFKFERYNVRRLAALP